MSRALEEMTLASAVAENSTWQSAGRVPVSESAETPAADDCYSLTEVATTEQLLADLGGYAITLWVVIGLEVVLLYGLFAKTLWRVYHDEKMPKPWRGGTAWTNSVHSFVTLMCLGSLIVPASDTLLNAIGVIYLSVAVSKFVDLCLLYFGGESCLLTAVGAIDIPLASPPLCCCCRPCCPTRAIGKRSLRVIKLLIYQLPFSQSGYFFFALYLYSASVPEVGEVSGNLVSSVLTSLNAVSFLLGMYGLSMFEKTTQGQLSHLSYRAKFSLMKFTLIIIKLQEFIFTIAISNGGVSCTASMSPKVYGAFIQNIVIAAEMLLLGVLGFWVYRSDSKSTDDVTVATEARVGSAGTAA